jgi:hypothetical protein
MVWQIKSLQYTPYTRQQVFRETRLKNKRDFA